MSTNLFEQFEATSAAAWKQKIQVDLKGDDYNESLLWKTDEGITVKPFYTKEDRTNAEFPMTPFDANICQSIYVDNEKIANQLAVDALNRGANSIEFKASKVFDPKTLLLGIDLQKTTLYFRLDWLDASFVNSLANFCNSKHCYFDIDIIAKLAASGNWFDSLNNDHSALESIVQNKSNSICINAGTYQNAGATSSQELAYALAHANEYLNYFGATSAAQFHFKFSVGGNYFFEIAKLRAFRMLWSALLNEHEAEQTEAHISCQPSLRNKTIYDYNVNMLRTTSECMSAILGGANTVLNTPYDLLFHKSNEFGERIARNQLLILQKECQLTNANTIADGAYYIESLSVQLAEKALAIFKTIETGGGFLRQLKQGTIQRKIEESALKEQDRFNNGSLVLIGSNKQENKTDLMKQDLALYPFVKTAHKKTLIAPIIAKRLAETYEKNRLDNE
ncbi:methylmalonyl-CoA mutase [Polaribacter pacificus]|uniref:Methylmalonyl-CoA mutase n=1 Tax=Polaribacter pacificus TaxID=1775173 RepID=A0A917I1F5_9FLAO|nr:methylmalonyl-CoA mutase subunit beta [Polaribacter pacificus]GGH01518.1 methylmalonyl-CoA mutase [Polaribacter pacificus]